MKDLLKKLRDSGGKLFGVLYAFAVICCLPAFFKRSGTIGFTYSEFSVVLFALILWSVLRFWKTFRMRSRAEQLLTGALAFAFLVCMAWGSMLDGQGWLELHDAGIWAAPVIVAPYVAMLIDKAYGEMEALIRRRGRTRQPDCSQATRRELAGYLVFLMVCWGIVLLGVFPGFFVYDAGDELLEVITRQFTTHHPLFHVLYMGGVVQAGYKLFGSYNAGILLFSMVQMALFAAGLVYAAAKMRAFGFGKRFCRIVIAFMGLFPVIPMCVLCSAKDSIFALVVFLWVLETWEWRRLSARRISVKWIIWSVLLCLLRYNAIYALAAAGVCMVIWGRKQRRALLISLAVSVIAAGGISACLTGVCNAAPPEHQELLTVPIQQLARTCRLEPETFSEEELRQLYGYLPEAYLARYRNKLSDGVKIGFVNEAYERDAAGFWRIWLAGLKRAPVSYLNAWLLTSYGYWYPDTVIDVYAGNEVCTFTYGDNAYFGYETEQPGERASLIPPIDDFYRKLSLEIYKEKLPAVSMLFSPGFLFWALLFCMGYLIRTRGIEAILPYIILVLMVGTLLLGPTFLPRYVFFLWFCIPFLLGDMIYTDTIEKKEEL
ncbi:MAG: DUF6020 family protein [Roseburia sp.]|nr:DUF6020 family protein [Roseburia sp.]